MSSSKAASEAVFRRLRAYVQRGVRTQSEARRFLDERGVPQEEAQRVLSVIAREGWLDDAAAAKLWAGHWARGNWASGAVREKLLQKGLTARDADQALASLDLVSGDEERAREFASLPSNRRSSRSVLARRLSARGFGSETIARVLGIPDEPVPSE